MGAADTKVEAAGLHRDVVLALSRKGREELGRPQAGISLPQRKLLKWVDGKRSLKDITDAEPALHEDRVARDAALLLGLGLVELEHGHLQPITRPSTVPPIVYPDTDPYNPRQRRASAPASAPARAQPQPRADRPRRGGIVAAFVAGGVFAGLGVYWAQSGPQSPTVVGTPAPAASAALKTPPAASAPAAVPAPVVTAAAQSAATPSPAAAVSNESAAPPPPAAAPSPPAPVAAAALKGPTAAPMQAPPSPPPALSPTPREQVAAIASPAARVTPPREQAAATSPPTTRPSTANSSPGGAVRTPAEPTPPASVQSPVAATPAAARPEIAAAPAAAPPAPMATAPAAPATATVATVDASKQPPPPAASEARLDVPTWARGFAPVAPDAADPRMVAVTTGLSPIERVPPVYPREAAREGISRGSVRARAIIAANGSVERVEFPSLDARNRVFERPARAALMTWSFPPGERGRVYEVVLNFIAP